MINCWLNFRKHKWQGWHREDAWLNMYQYHNPMPIGIMVNRCSNCTMIKLKSIYRLRDLEEFKSQQ